MHDESGAMFHVIEGQGKGSGIRHGELWVIVGIDREKERALWIEFEAKALGMLEVACLAQERVRAFGRILGAERA